MRTREEFIKSLLEEGYEYWGGGEEVEIYGRTTYNGGRTDIGTEAEDWEEWHVYKDKAIHKFGTNRSVPGWALCPACGTWYQHDEEELHEDCKPEVVYFSP